MPCHNLRRITTNMKRLTRFLDGAIVDKPAIEERVDELFQLDTAGGPSQQCNGQRKKQQIHMITNSGVGSQYSPHRATVEGRRGHNFATSPPFRLGKTAAACSIIHGRPPSPGDAGTIPLRLPTSCTGCTLPGGRRPLPPPA